MGTKDVQIRLFFLIQLACLAGISLISSYKLPDLSEVSWDTVLFLTPLGIIKNYLDKNPVMRSFYGDYAKERVALSVVHITFLICIILFLIGLFWKIVKILEKKDI